jgi:Tfp pilus assembly protein PilF
VNQSVDRAGAHSLRNVTQLLPSALAFERARPMRIVSISYLAPLLASLAQLAGPASAAPFTPASDTEVLEVLPARAADPRMRELRQLRADLARDPQSADAAVRLARRYYEEVAAEGDPRYIGYAQAALAPWWAQANPPVPVRVMRAIVLQFSHQFDAALADLDAATQQDPQHGEAWAWQAAIRLVQADYAGARRACEQVAQLATPLIGSACRAQVDSLTGQAEAAAAALQDALSRNPQATPEEQLWALTRLAETEHRRGRHAEAEAAYRRALALNITDGYLLAAYADFLLDRQRPAEVLVLLKDKTRSDLLLLRLALAAKALKDPALAAWQNDLTARFDAARLRGDSVHEKEEARFALAVLGDAPRALALARKNYGVQREPADARVLLEAAVAARQPAAAEPVLQWLASSHIESVALQSLARELKGGS